MTSSPKKTNPTVAQALEENKRENQEIDGKVIAQAMNKEPMPSVHTAWEGDEKTETAYLSGWHDARKYYALLISKGWPHNDKCLTKFCVFQRGHTGEHVLA